MVEIADPFAPSVLPSGAPLAGYNIQATPDAFGAQAGQATSGLGQAMAGTGNMLSDSAARMQMENNEAAANSRASDYETALTKLTSDPNSGFLLKKGLDAYSGIGDAIDTAGQLRTQMADGLSPDAQRGYDNMTRRSFDWTVKGMATHAANERRSYLNDASNARIASIANTAIDDYGNDEAFGYAVGAIKGQVAIQARNNGWDPQTADNKLQAYTSGPNLTFGAHV